MTDMLTPLSTLNSAVEMRGISKSFFGVGANRDVNLSVRWGEVHGLLGENGAGKTTLMSILAGLYRPDEGTISVDGGRVVFHSPADAIQHGIGMVYQHYKLVPSQTVAENLLLGLPRAPFRLSTSAVASQIRDLSERYHLHVDAARPVWQLSVGEQQRVEILRTLHRGARIVVLDEPTAVLTPQEADELMRTIRRVAAEGRSVILISHKLEEVRSVADRVTVLRAGTVVGSALETKALTSSQIARLMVGDDVSQAVKPTRKSFSEAPRLILDQISARDRRGLLALANLCLSVHGGEIVGVAGVAGNGQRELARIVSGMEKPQGGRVLLDGADVTGNSARQMIQLGIAHIPEDRTGEGLAGNLPLTDNAVLKSYDRAPLARGPMLQPGAIRRFTQGLIERFRVTGARPSSTTRLLSGGQLQRFLLAREMALSPRVVVAVHPTRGVDVAATNQVHEWLLEASEKGASVLLISEDLDEVLELSDRVAVLYRGEIVGVVDAAGSRREDIGLMMAGSLRMDPEAA